VKKGGLGGGFAGVAGALKLTATLLLPQQGHESFSKDIFQGRLVRSWESSLFSFGSQTSWKKNSSQKKQVRKKRYRLGLPPTH